jgi:hypothetical protein
VVEEVHGTADGGCVVKEVDRVAEVGEVQGGGHAGETGADDEDRFRRGRSYLRFVVPGSSFVHGAITHIDMHSTIESPGS